MKKRNYSFVTYTSLISLAIGCLVVFQPRTYPVPLVHQRVGTQYWQLPTGSRIAFTLVAAKRRSKPFPILYLHGGPGGHIHQGLINSLAPLADDGYAIYFYDQIGSGFSDRLADIADYTVDRHISDLDAITQKLGGQVILIGQSWGTILATLFTARYPQRTQHLILSSPGPIFPMHQELVKLPTPDSIHLRAPIFTNAQGNKKANNIRTKAMVFLASSFGWQLASNQEADAFATYGGYQVDRSTVCDTALIPEMEPGNGFYAGVRTYKSLLEMKDYRMTFRKLKTQVSILKGECDNLPWGYTQEYLAVFPNHRLTIIPGAGHFLWVEQPTLYLNAIREFLRDKPSDTRKPYR
ncbi:alpha/beta fold hydrolase [Spirosoma sp. HMF4905]|uniref:Alpha/beta fold hydrolase n=1 Tax=Spirosoma arboris TaxID=2682092 RepID=A0A7K1SPN3_9BACT|nr:alpha/beta hydrolase [Spirosoma arboris]MVM35643.1 alpha/beta fold hydrolase [Spirosoma arboris]